MAKSLIEIRHYGGGNYGVNGFYWFHPAVKNGPPKVLHGTKDAARREALEAIALAMDTNQLIGLDLERTRSEE